MALHQSANCGRNTVGVRQEWHPVRIVALADPPSGGCHDVVAPPTVRSTSGRVPRSRRQPAVAVAVGARQHRIQNVKHEYCMDVPDHDGVPAGTPISEYHCNTGDTDNQVFVRPRLRRRAPRGGPAAASSATTRTCAATPVRCPARTGRDHRDRRGVPAGALPTGAAGTGQRERAVPELRGDPGGHGDRGRARGLRPAGWWSR